MFLSREWRFRRVMLGLIAVEFPLTVACLALTGIASPDLYRTKLWQEGGDHGFNSSPVTIVYAYANYRPVNTPVVWSDFQTRFNLVVSVLSMFLLLTKLTMFITNTFWPVAALVTHAVLVVLWSVSLWAQTAPDTIDPKHPNNGAPWYLTKGCGIASTGQLQGYCMQAKSVFAVSALSLILFVVWMVLSAWSMAPTREQKAARAAELASEAGSTMTATAAAEKKLHMTPEEEQEQFKHQWEMSQLPLSSPVSPGSTGGLKSPVTPRTRAFRALSGHGAPSPAPAPAPIAVGSATSTGQLPFRSEKY